MKYIGIDLGSTNTKVTVYHTSMSLAGVQSCPVSYARTGKWVEFDAKVYAEDLCALLAELVSRKVILPGENCRLALTGQAETLVVLGADGEPICPAISWMDERSEEECRILSEQFDYDTCYLRTGQAAVLPTWPATKVLWLKRNRPEIFSSAKYFLMLKDYIVYYLTGRLMADMSIATFSFFFDIYRKSYWREMLEACAISEDRLAPLVEPCTDAGNLREELCLATGLGRECVVNIGTLDHFAGMIGTGNLRPGDMSLSTGTVMALATMARNPVNKNSGIAMHYGFLPDTYVMLPVAESGGACLEWLKNTCMGDISYEEMNRVLAERTLPGEVLCLPYLIGTNAPEFDVAACGGFLGLRANHDIFDMAYAVMEGVAFLLRKNTEAIREAGTMPRRIIATGGGAKSELWCRLYADATGIPVVIPREKEAACLGAAIIAAVADGRYASFEDACEVCVSMAKSFEPVSSPALERKYRQFRMLYEACLEIMKADC